MRILLSLMLLCTPLALQAGFKINPKLVYNNLSLDDGSSKSDGTGLGYGLGVGYSFIGLYAMLEYETATLSVDGNSNDPDFTNTGLVVGYEFPILLNVWLNYVTSSEIKDTVGTLKGSGTKFGIGYSIAPFIQLTLEFVNLEYDKLGSLTLTTKQKMTGQQIGIQIPF